MNAVGRAAYVALFAEVGVALFVTTLLGALTGHWLDQQLSTNPIFGVSGFLLGAAMGAVVAKASAEATASSRARDRAADDRGWMAMGQYVAADTERTERV
jgi:F0F1-type ATP synthase assembly protein I